MRLRPPKVESLRFLYHLSSLEKVIKLRPSFIKFARSGFARFRIRQEVIAKIGSFSVGNPICLWFPAFIIRSFVEVLAIHTAMHIGIANDADFRAPYSALHLSV
jgi:hypothetical protein